METAQERFLKNREERDSVRQSAKEKGSDEQILTEQRKAVLRELQACEEQVSTALARKEYQSADDALRKFRQLVQDSTATETLTAYEMAKANQTVLKLHAERHSASKKLDYGLSEHQTSSLANCPTSGIASASSVDAVREAQNTSLSSPCKVISTDFLSSSSSNPPSITSVKQRFRFSAPFVSEAENKEPKDNSEQSEKMDYQPAEKLSVSTFSSTKLVNKQEGNHFSSAKNSSVIDDCNSYGPAKNTNLFVPSSTAFFLRECKECQVFVLPIRGSAFLTGLKSCRVFIACSQLRLKDCDDVEVYAWVTSTPIIENCDNMRFGPYSCWKGLLLGSVPLPAFLSMKGSSPTERHFNSNEDCIKEFLKKEFASGESRWKHVEDFQWLKKTASPHWRALEPHEYHYAEELFQQPPLTP